MVISTGAGFTGYYIVDQKPMAYIEDNTDVSGVYSYSKDAGELKYIEVFVQNKANATSLKIKVYRNSVKVKEGSLDNITGIKTLDLTYRFNEENAPKTTP